MQLDSEVAHLSPGFLKQYDLAFIVASSVGCGNPGPVAHVVHAIRGSLQPKLVLVTTDVVLSSSEVSQYCAPAGGQLPNTLSQSRDNELLMYSNFSLILTSCEESRRGLSALLGSLPIQTLPLVPSAVPSIGCARSPEAAGWFERSGFAFVGTFHGANQRALRWLLNAVWPELRQKLPMARLMLVGAREWHNETIVAHGATIAVHDRLDNMAGVKLPLRTLP